MAADVQPGTTAAAIIEEEERLHARVQARAAADLTRPGGGNVGAAYDRDLIELRDAIGEAKPEDLAPLVEQMTRLAALRGHVGGSQSLPIDTASPYFAHMVLREGERRRDVLIGKRGYIDRKHNIQIVDWRNAPVSQIYYRYDEGDDYEEEIAGRLAEGILEIRRNVSIARASLRRIGAPQGTFVRGRDGNWRHASGEANPALHGGQGSAARAPRPAPPRIARGRGARSKLGTDSDHAPRADKHLPEIAALIDSEQFELITRPSSGIVAIQGGAGSGKTTVALHRMAYLTFAEGRYRPRSMLFVVPTRALARYVSDVLPALGVHGVPVHTYAAWAQKTRQRLLPGTGGKYNEATPEAVTRVKKHPAVEAALRRLVDDQTDQIGAELEALATGEAAPALGRWRQSRGSALVPRLRKLRFWLRKGPVPAAAAVPIESAIKRWLRRADDVVGDWGELFSDRGRLEASLGQAAGLRSGDIAAAVRWTSDQLSEPPEGGPEAVDGRDLDEDSPAGRWDREDDPVLLRLIQLKRGGLFDEGGKQVQYRHVAIDEAQDRSAIEIRVLIEATEADDDGAGRRARSITLAGDMAQRVVFDNNLESWDQLLEAAGLGGTEVHPLRISYRSTAEVMDLARRILGPELDSGEPLIARSGAPVEIHELGDVGEAVAFLGDALRSLMHREPTASAVVLARYPEQADAYYAGLQRSEVPRLRRVQRDEFAFQPGVDVTEVSQVKGLEFDYVVMVDVNAASYPANLETRHLLHIGATRAAHQLWLVTSGDPSPLIPEDAIP